jgi:sugar phosphate isomerase/epimerase
MKLHFQVLDAIRNVGEPHMTVHVGLDFGMPLNHDRTVENLSRLVKYGRRHGITISLENLRRGPTSDPEILVAWAEQSGSRITLDVGHAVSCRKVRNKEVSVLQIIDMIGRKLTEVHLYEFETDRHHAPHNMRILGPVVDRLITTGCPWWTIELDATEDILRTRELVYRHFAFNRPLL